MNSRSYKNLTAAATDTNKNSNLKKLMAFQLFSLTAEKTPENQFLTRRGITKTRESKYTPSDVDDGVLDCQDG